MMLSPRAFSTAARGARGAVVFDVVVAVGAVFGQCLPFEEAYEALFCCRVEVELVCYGAATFAIVLSHKGVVGPCYGDIVGPAHDEAADEVGRVEVENAVVVGFTGLPGI